MELSSDSQKVPMTKKEESTYVEKASMNMYLLFFC